MKFERSAVTLSLAASALGEPLCPDGSIIPPFHLQYLHVYDLEAFSASGAEGLREQYKQALPRIFGTLNEWFGPQTETALATFSTKREEESEYRWCHKMDLGMGPHSEEEVTSAVAPYLGDEHDFYSVAGTVNDVFYKALRSDEYDWIHNKFDENDLRVVHIVAFSTDKKTDLEGAYPEKPKVVYLDAAREDCNAYDFPASETLISAINDFPGFLAIFHTSSENFAGLNDWYLNTWATTMVQGLVPTLTREISGDPMGVLQLVLQHVQNVICTPEETTTVVPPPTPSTCEEMKNAYIDAFNAANGV